MIKRRNTSQATPPLTARSVVASTLLGAHPPRMATRLLVATGELFGISAGTMRVAISRMVAAGELAADDDGYRLRGELLDRQVRQDTSRRAHQTPWSKSWDIWIVSGVSRSASERTDLRRAMRRLKIAELREGAWSRPANLDPDRDPNEAAIVSAQCELFSAVPAGEPTALAARLWDLDRWAEAADRLVDELMAWETELLGGDIDAIAPSFVTSAVVLRHIVADPLLPNDLLPSDWPGERLRSTYDSTNEAFRDLYVSWLRDQA